MNLTLGLGAAQHVHKSLVFFTMKNTRLTTNPLPSPMHPVCTFLNVPVYASTARTCVSICARDVRTHGDVLDGRTPHTTSHHKTQHNTTQHDTPHHTTTTRPQHHTETEKRKKTETEREEKTEDKTRQDKTKREETRDKRREKREERREQNIKRSREPELNCLINYPPSEN